MIELKIAQGTLNVSYDSSQAPCCNVSRADYAVEDSEDLLFSAAADGAKLMLDCCCDVDGVSNRVGSNLPVKSSMAIMATRASPTTITQTNTFLLFAWSNLSFFPSSSDSSELRDMTNLQ